MQSIPSGLNQPRSGQGAPKAGTIPISSRRLGPKQPPRSASCGVPLGGSTQRNFSLHRNFSQGSNFVVPLCTTSDGSSSTSTAIVSSRQPAVGRLDLPVLPQRTRERGSIATALQVASSNQQSVAGQRSGSVEKRLLRQLREAGKGLKEGAGRRTGLQSFGIYPHLPAAALCHRRGCSFVEGGSICSRGPIPQRTKAGPHRARRRDTRVDGTTFQTLQSFPRTRARTAEEGSRAFLRRCHLE